MKRFTFTFLILLGLLLNAGCLVANNIQVSSISLTGANTTDEYVLVQFDLSWENSWRTSSAPNNWDAAWVFVKYRVGTGEWQHASLNNTGHSPGTGTGATIDAGLRTPGSAFDAATNPAVGVFIYRDADGTGNFSITDTQLRWNFVANGVANDATVDVKVFAIEMVYVPQGVFYVGSGGEESGSFTDGSWSSGATIPLLISSEEELTIGQSDGNLWGTSTSGNSTIGDAGTLPAAFPKGFAAFYSMKYSITQQQYVDFLNTLTQTQATVRENNTDFGEDRYQISKGENEEYATTNPYVACNYLSWMDGAAYADWAGLRPMTELEYEKAARGPANPVANEYAWGTALVKSGTYTLNNQGVASESIETGYSDSDGNAYYNSTKTESTEQEVGPVRVGIFAIVSSTRAQSGASYYGIMELSDNVRERPVTVGNANGRAFTGVHGDGALSDNGHATETNWPGLGNNGEVIGATGSGVRGGSWFSPGAHMSTSFRLIAAIDFSTKSTNKGFRGVRTAP